MGRSLLKSAAIVHQAAAAAIASIKIYILERDRPAAGIHKKRNGPGEVKSAGAVSSLRSVI
jgi:hypothetical protein